MQMLRIFMIKAKASGSKVYLDFYEKGQAGETPHYAEFFFFISDILGFII